MVDDYRLNREAQLQLAEGVFRQDEDYRATTFKEWLQAFEWESARERYEQDAAARDGAHHDEHEARDVSNEDVSGRTGEDLNPWAAHRVYRERPVVPAQRTTDHDRLSATEGAAEDLGEAERAQQLARWHTDDHDADQRDADERGTADLADLYGRSA